MAIEAIIFDMDDTLVVEVASAEAAFVAAYKLLPEEAGVGRDDFVSTVRKKARELWYDFPAHDYCAAIGISSWEGLWSRFGGDNPNMKTLRKWAPFYQRQSWANALSEFDIKDESLPQLLSETFQSHRRQLHIVYSDVEGVLKQLQQSYKLALVTNGSSDLQREKLEGSRLGRYFDIVIISGDLGIRKPDPRIFSTVIDRLGVSVEMAVMVGNSLESDIAGAQQVGIKSVWLNRDGKKDDDSVQADHEIANLSKLQAMLNNME